MLDAIRNQICQHSTERIGGKNDAMISRYFSRERNILLKGAQNILDKGNQFELLIFFAGALRKTQSVANKLVHRFQVTFEASY